jgi:hypothetical protein
MKRELKPQRLWAVTYSNCPEAMPWTVRRTRKQAIRTACHLDDWGSEDFRPEWTRMKKQGCKTVRVVLITEQPK